MKKYEKIMPAAVFLLIMPLVLHVLLSRFGFNPTDDGFTLAYSRRMLDGQLPYRDFIIIRPFLSPLLHLPILLMTEDYTYLLSRYFVWFQSCCIAFFWVLTIENNKGKNFGRYEKYAYIIIALIYSIHTFPLMAWHTIDGLFFIAIGTYLCSRKTILSKSIGYFMIGMAYLCKQRFIVASPAIMLAFRDWKSIRYWSFSLLPGILYLFFLFFAGLVPEAYLQMTAQTSIVKAGFLSYLNRGLAAGCIIGLLFVANFAIQKPTTFISKITRLIGHPFTVMIISVLWVGRAMVLDMGYETASLGVFGIISGMIIGKIVHSIECLKDGSCEVEIVALVIAWCASISIGYNSPVLASGQMLTIILFNAKQSLFNTTYKKVYVYLLPVLTSLTAFVFIYSRTNHIYRDLPVFEQKCEISSFIPGTKGVMTNKNTYAFLQSLNDAIKIIDHNKKKYSIIPDCAGFWPKSKQANPLSIDWPQSVELNSEPLVNRVYNDVMKYRGELFFIVQKHEARTLHAGFFPLDDKNYKIVQYVKQTLMKIDENEHFEIYR